MSNKSGMPISSLTQPQEFLANQPVTFADLRWALDHWQRSRLEHCAESLERAVRELRDKLETDSMAWDDKNEDVESPKGCSADYVYGYNAGVSEGFRAAMERVTALLGPLPKGGAK